MYSGRVPLHHVVARCFSDVKFTDIRVLPSVSTEEEYALRRIAGSLTDNPALVGVDVETIRAQGNTLVMDPKYITYANALLNRLNHRAVVQAISINALVITRDNFIVCGFEEINAAQRHGKIAIPSRLVRSEGSEVDLYSQVMKLLDEELWLVTGQMKQRPLFGFMTGVSERDRKYQLAITFPLVTGYTMESLSAFYTAKSKNFSPAFNELNYIENVPNQVLDFVAKHDARINSLVHSRTLDVLSEWGLTYGCDIGILVEARNLGTQVYLPQPKILENV